MASAPKSVTALTTMSAKFINAFAQMAKKRGITLEPEAPPETNRL